MDNTWINSESQSTPILGTNLPVRGFSFSFNQNYFKRNFWSSNDAIKEIVKRQATHNEEKISSSIHRKFLPFDNEKKF